jgi:ribose transport system permease protein
MHMPHNRSDVVEPPGGAAAEGPAKVPTKEPGERRHRFGTGDILARYAVLVALVVFIGAFSLLLPETFPTSGNFSTMVNSQAMVLILALGVTLPLRTGDFDLSIAAVMAFCAAFAAIMAGKHGMSVPVTILLTLLVGAGIGAVNALLIVKIGIDAFIATLASMTVLGGATYAITGGHVFADIPNPLLDFSRNTLNLGIINLPLGTYYGWILALILWYVYERVPFGRFLLFVGGNRDAARLAGVPVDRIRIAAFVGSAVFGAFAGVVLVGTLGAVDPSFGPQYLLPPYAAAFLGTAAIQLGRFNVWGTLIGLYLLVVGITGLQLYGAQPWVSDVFNGTALAIAVTFARLAKLRAAKS